MKIFNIDGNLYKSAAKNSDGSWDKYIVDSDDININELEELSGSELLEKIGASDSPPIPKLKKSKYSPEAALVWKLRKTSGIDFTKTYKSMERCLDVALAEKTPLDKNRKKMCAVAAHSIEQLWIMRTGFDKEEEEDLGMSKPEYYDILVNDFKLPRGIVDEGVILGSELTKNAAFNPFAPYYGLLWERGITPIYMNAIIYCEANLRQGRATKTDIDKALKEMGYSQSQLDKYKPFYFLWYWYKNMEDIRNYQQYVEFLDVMEEFGILGDSKIMDDGEILNPKAAMSSGSEFRQSLEKITFWKEEFTLVGSWIYNSIGRDFKGDWTFIMDFHEKFRDAGKNGIYKIVRELVNGFEKTNYDTPVSGFHDTYKGATQRRVRDTLDKHAKLTGTEKERKIEKAKNRRAGYERSRRS